MWVDDPSFNLEYHVRHTALPAPGSEEQLRALAARIVSQRLDRSKPLWEMWLVQGLEDDRFALISKTHHALVDGVSGVDLATVIFDLAPEPASVEPAREGAVGARSRSRARSSWRRAASAGWSRTPFDLAARAVERRDAPDRDGRGRPRGGRGRRRDRLGRAEPGAGDAAQRPDRPAPPARRSCARELEDFKRSRTPSAARSTTSC